MLYQKIKTYMEQRGIKQKAVAEKIKMNPNTFSATINGKRKLLAEEYFSICIALDVRPEELLKGEALCEKH